MSKKLFVGGLPWATSDEDLAELFAQYGEVSDAKVITDRETGRSRGFGFVSMDDDDAATEAMRSLDGSEFQERRLKVNVAHERQQSSGGGRSPFGGGGGGHRGRH